MHGTKYVQLLLCKNKRARPTIDDILMMVIDKHVVD